MSRFASAARALLAASIVVAVASQALPARADGAPSSPDDVVQAPEPGDALDIAAALEAAGVFAYDGEPAGDVGALADDLLREAAAFREHPLDVNSAPLGNLLRLPFLDPGAALRIVAARAEGGPFATTEELVDRGCLSPEAYALVAPYVTAVAPRDAVAGAAGNAGARTARAAGNARAAPAPALRWSALVRGSSSSTVASRAPGSFARLRAAHGDRLRLGLACERDQGEASLADHAALGAEWRPVEGLRVGVGDLGVAWGQGLVAGASGIASVAGFPRRSERLRIYDGASESTARRGAYAEAERGILRAQVVLARTRLDAGLNAEGLVSSLRASGLHRTDGERAGRDALEEELVAVRLTLAPRPGARFAATVARFRYDPAFAAGDPERQRFRFAGSALRLGGADALLRGERWQVGAEVAATEDGAAAWAGAAKASLGRAAVAFGAARFAPDYWSPLGSGAPGVPGGMNGAAAWLRVAYRPAAGTEAWCEALVTRRPWRSYLCELPDGRRQLAFGIERPFGALGRVSLTLRETARFTEGGDPRRGVREVARSARLDWRASGDPRFTVSALRAAQAARAESAGPGGESATGSAFALGVRTESPVGDRARLDAGCFVVSRRGDAPTLTVYEPRLPGEFGLVSLNASGARWYARLRAGLGAGVGISARVAGGPGRGRLDAGAAIEYGG